MKAGSCLLLLFLVSYSYSATVLQEDIAFPSGITLKPVSEDARFKDEEKTGSRIFKLGLGGVRDDRRVSLNIMIGDWRDKSQDFFRIHPVFIACLQKVWTEVQKSGKSPKVIQGFLAGGGTSLRDRYRKSGTGAALGFAASVSNKDFKLMAKAFLRNCPPLFGPLGRDIGLIVERDAIFAYMTGTNSPSVQSVTVSGNSQFAGLDINTWVRNQLNEVTDPLSVPACGAGKSALANGGIHPSSSSSNPSDTVGGLDKVVKRSTSYPDREDFLRLVQFSSDNIVFLIPSSETSSCPVSGGIRGNGPTTRCGPRLMAPRLYVKLNVLQKMVRNTMSTKLKVEEGYTQDSVGTANALRGEGRQAKIRLVASNTVARLGEASKLAICAGFDFVRHGGDHLIVAVAKQYKKSTKPISFPKGSLIPVAVPHADWENLYKLADGYSPDDFPLFDSQYRPTSELEEGTTASSFKSQESDVRYFRISPLLVKCLSEVNQWENRGKAEGDANIKVVPVRAFMSKMEEESLFNPIDNRLDKHTLGLALHLKYEGNPKGYDVLRLASTVATVCPSIFYNQEDKSFNGRNAGLGIYNDGVYIDIREKLKVWFECETCIKSSSPPETIKAQLKTRMTESQANRIIDPNNMKVACEFDSPPKPQSAEFVHEHSEATMRVRRSTTGTPDCQMSAALSAFCSKSWIQREEEKNKVWNIIKMKHLLKDENDVKMALEGCLLSCSKCTSGPQWDSKVQHCNNLVHWIPFEFLNDQDGVVTNIYPRSDSAARIGACDGTGHCLDQSPIFGLFAPALDSKFRPEAGKANKELVYDPVQNPSPLMSLISRLYGLYAKGRVIVWLRSEADISGMEDLIKVIFVYNKKVDTVHLNILEKSAEGSIISSLEGRLDAWRTMVCPKHTRIALSPYTVAMATIPQSSAFNVRQQILTEEEISAVKDL